MARATTSRVSSSGGSAGALVTLEPPRRLVLAVGGLRREALRDVAEHEALAFGVLEDAAVAAHTLGHQHAAHRGRPHHAGRMELGELHVHQLGAGLVGHTEAVAAVLPGVGGDAPGLAGATGGEDDRFGAEQHEAAGLAPVGHHAGGPLAILHDVERGAFHVHRDPLVDAVILQGADHLEAGAIADVSQSGVAVSPKVALADQTVLGPVEDRPPFFEFADSVRGVLGVQLRHAPVVEELAAAHRVAKVDLPVVATVDVAQSRRHAALGHHGMRFAEQRLADDPGVETAARALDGGAQTCPTGADDDHVVLTGLDFGEAHHGLNPKCSDPSGSPSKPSARRSR